MTIEENSFYKTIDKGMEILKADIAEMKKEGQTVMSGEKSFRLYDTYGFPIDLTKEILEEEGFGLDESAFEKEMKQQKDRARAARGESTFMGADENVYNQLDVNMETKFAGYDVKQLTDAKVIALITNDAVAENASAGDSVCVFLDNTPFYAESGGQVGDNGVIKTETGMVEITDCIKVVGGKIAHIGTVKEGSISVGDTACAEIDMTLRMATSRNHSATHLLQKALRTVLGTHVEQAGSYVSAERLRFDFTHFTALTEQELKQVENMVNEKIFESLAINTCEKSIDEARQMGAMALFGEKYGDIVRVVTMGDFSIELCGGAHLTNTAQVGSFKIISENGIAAGVRRIEALTGTEALKYYQSQEEQMKNICRIVKANAENVVNKVEQIVAEQKELSKQIEKLKSKLAGGAVEEILSQKQQINGVSVVCAKVQDADGNALKTMGDQLKVKLCSGVVVLASGKGDKVNLLAMATDDVVKKGIHSGNIVKAAAACCGGGGGGRPNMAQAGGKDASKIEQALQKAKEVIQEQL